MWQTKTHDSDHLIAFCILKVMAQFKQLKSSSITMVRLKLMDSSQNHDGKNRTISDEHLYGSKGSLLLQSTF
jgi:hypothetical protein